MKKLLLFVASAMIVFASCDKKTTTTTPTPTPTPTPSGPTPPTPTPSGNDISGALISIKMDYSTQPTGSPIPISLISEIGTAVFYTTPGGTTFADAGTVSVNGTALEKQTNNSYNKLATTGMTPSSLNFGSGSSSKSSWSVGGAGSVAAFSYDHMGTFPNYSGTLPTSVTKSSGVTLTLNSSTVSGADSVYVVIAAGSSSFTKGYSATAGSITISTSDLSSLPTVSDNTALMQVCPFKYLINTIGGKKYVFIKEQAIVKNININ
ncbi:hypothetical protein CAP35_05520 [Chitinophagaceae bacterium IBVUCB1]|nr:hypothetical protein CAP35_05520 [Chitinophagaceae bacterium IBVUCB1]